MENLGDMVGSDELTTEEFKDADDQHEQVLAELYKTVEESDEAKAFLNTKFGVSLRKHLVAEKFRTMKACADDPTNGDHKYSYDVICGVERMFAYIISDGNEALNQLQHISKIGDLDEE